MYIIASSCSLSLVSVESEVLVLLVSSVHQPCHQWTLFLPVEQNIGCIQQSLILKTSPRNQFKYVIKKIARVLFSM